MGSTEKTGERDAQVRPYTFTDLLSIDSIRSVGFMVDMFVETTDFRVLFDYENDAIIYEIKVDDRWVNARWDQGVLRSA